MKNTLWFLMLSATLILSSCKQGTPTSKTLSQEVTPERYLEPVFDSIMIQENIVFGESVNFDGVNQDLLLDIYSPANDDVKNRPAILWIHGGGFLPEQDKSQSYIVRMSTRFAKRGYVCLSINYRVREKPKDDCAGTMKDALEDAMSGLVWLRENSEELGVDKSRIVIGGGSAGGAVAVNFCYRDIQDLGDWDKSGIVGMVALWGSPKPEWNFYKVKPGDPPGIMVHGTEDVSVPYQTSLDLVKEMDLNGVRNELVTIEGAGHSPHQHMDSFAINVSTFLYDLIKE